MREINLQQLIDYLKCVFELEGQLYKNQKLIDGYINKRKSDMPAEPVKVLPSAVAPEPSLYVATKTNYIDVSTEEAIFLSIIFVISAFFGSFFILFPLIEGELTLPVLFLSIIGIMVAFVSLRKLTKIVDKVHQKHLQDIEFYKTKKAEAIRVYEVAMQSHNQIVKEYHEVSQQQIAKFTEVKKSLQDSLDKLYSQNVIYSKYRNFVAIATIYEYFESGRCTELEGPNGAYNMYESELRSNIVICSLAQIISDLAQIKDNQYALYELINEHNQEVSSLLSDIYNEQALTTYYAKAAAEAAEASRYATGAIFLSQAHK